MSAPPVWFGPAGGGSAAAMAADEEHTVDSARAAAARDELGAWVTAFLGSPGSDNAELADLLTEQGLCWLGPVQLPLDQLGRLAGPPGAPVMEEVDDEYWRDDVDELARRIEDGLQPPPTVVTYRDGDLVLEDGNHRVEALRRAGVGVAWCIVGFRDAEERDRFVVRSEDVEPA